MQDEHDDPVCAEVIAEGSGPHEEDEAGSGRTGYGLRPA